MVTSLARITATSMLLACATWLTAQTTAQAANLSGSVRDSGKPFPGALIHIQTFRDRKCAKLFQDKEYSDKKLHRLQNCTSELPDITSDSDGNYRAERLAPGLYAVHILWRMQNPPQQSMMCKHGEWVIAYVPGRDKTGKYNAMAQQIQVFELKQKESKTIDLDYVEQLPNQIYSHPECISYPPRANVGADQHSSGFLNDPAAGTVPQPPDPTQHKPQG